VFENKILKEDFLS